MNCQNGLMPCRFQALSEASKHRDGQYDASVSSARDKTHARNVRVGHPSFGGWRTSGSSAAQALARAGHLAHHRYSKSRLAALWHDFGPGVCRSGGRNGQKASRAPVPSHRGSCSARASIASQSSATADDAQPFHRADWPMASRSCQTLGGFEHFYPSNLVGLWYRGVCRLCPESPVSTQRCIRRAAAKIAASASNRSTTKQAFPSAHRKVSAIRPQRRHNSMKRKGR